MTDDAPPPPPAAEAPPPAPSRRRRWLLVALAAGGGLVLLGGGLLAELLLRAPALDRAALPPGVGARGPGFEVVAADGVPLLLEGDLPYPTDLARPKGARLDLDGIWQLRLDPEEQGREAGWPGADLTDEAGWGPVEVPSTFDAPQGLHPDYDGVSWFRRGFSTPDLSPGARARLCFRAVLLRAEVWLNGERVGAHEGGYTPFYLDVTERLRRDGAQNVLVVRADDRLTYTSLPPRIRETHRAGWAPYGGIARSVYLDVLPAAYVAKAAATPRLSGGAPAFALEVAVHLREAAPFRVAARLIDPDGAEVGRHALERTPTATLAGARFELSVPAPRRWSPRDPALYRIELTLEQGEVRDEVAFHTGLREVAVAGDRLLLNGEPLALEGIAKHEDHPRFGLTQPPELLETDLTRLQQLGVNFVRIAHYPHATRALDRYRDAGLLMCEELPLYQAGMGWLGWLGWDRDPRRFPSEWFGLRQLHNPELLRNCQQQLLEMVERDRNNPAIVLWSVGNECYSLGESTRPVYRWLGDVVRSFDATRPLTFSELTYGVAALDDRRQATAEMDVASLNMYFGWYFGAPADAGPYLDRYRERFPEVPVLITECGAGAAPGRSDADGLHAAEGVTPGRTFSEEYQARVLSELYGVAAERSYVVGFCPWVFADFRCPWFPNNPVPGYNLKGLLSRERRPKQAFEALSELYRAQRGGQ